MKVLAAFLYGVVAERISLERDVTVFEAPNWKRVSRATPAAKVSPTFMLRHNADDLKKFEETFYAVSTPGHYRYGQHLSRAEVAEQLPCMAGSKEAVLALLSEHNVDDIEVYDDMIKATMPVPVAEEMFSTEIYRFEHQVNGVQVLRVGAPYSLPEDVGALVYNVADLVQLPALDGVKIVKDDFSSKSFLDDFPNGCGGGCKNKVTPDVLAALYNFDTNPTNLKTTMAVAEFQGVSYDNGDLQHFEQQCDVNNITVATQVGKNHPSRCKVPLIGSELCLEALLDIDYIKGVAGDIPLTVVSAAQYSLANWAQQLQTMDNPPPIMSVSYGNDEIQQTSEDFMDSANVQFQKLGAMGMSVLFASGDQGVVGRTGKTRDGKYHPDFPAASPFITAVGGTDLATKSVIGAEKAWSDGGGGFSDHFAAPEYQVDAVTAYLKKSDDAALTPDDAVFTRTGRGYPDLAAMAGQQNPYCVAASLTGITSNMVGVAGTSASCPVVAGLFARINAARSAQGKPNMGFLNPFIYQNPQAFNDVTLGSVTGASVQGFTALEGWDAATGMGTPNFPKLMDAALAAASTITV